jgi:hypothetical protein
VARLNDGELGIYKTVLGRGFLINRERRRDMSEMDVADAMGAVTIENGGVNGKLVLPDSVEEHGEQLDAQANRDHSGESEVINPQEEAGGEATSHPEGRKIRPSKVIFRQRCFLCVW